jgi:dihydropteroate synthase
MTVDTEVARPARPHTRAAAGGLRLAGGRRLAWGDRPLVMGVLNLTPDSFSDGGLHLEPGRALARAEQLIADGADLLDLGAESTRPGGGVYGTGARPVSAAEELDRLLPVLEPLRRATGLPLSVDTRKADVARAALASGADLVNDVSALGDAGMAEVVAAADCPLVLMHSRGELPTMQRGIHFLDVVEEVRRELAERVAAAQAAGIPFDRLLVDPGIGFGKTGPQNLRLLARLDRLDLGLPVVVGASRKSFIGELTGAPPAERLPGSLAAAAWAAHHGAAVVRVHDVAATRQFLTVWQAIHDAPEADGS